ncbi:hypothetical protein T281_16090 [Rhodomicrobium udaipurense JA643]|nr:hypothetical protein T281_16090 [Rhodomicrobium udaipurense JA643]
MSEEPKERPILFSAPMVRAILEGRKTQTRRIVKRQPAGAESVSQTLASDVAPDKVGAWEFWAGKPQTPLSDPVFCPYGRPGDRLWVRETWADASSENGPVVLYRAGNDRRYLVDESYPVDYDRFPIKSRDAWSRWAADVEGGSGGYRPSIHMPRWASRISLEITDIRVERLQDINEEDARAEGVAPWRRPVAQSAPHFAAFADLWRGLNGPDSWAANPWVWVVAFHRVNAFPEVKP